MYLFVEASSKGIWTSNKKQGDSINTKICTKNSLNDQNLFFYFQLNEQVYLRKLVKRYLIWFLITISYKTVRFKCIPTWAQRNSIFHCYWFNEQVTWKRYVNKLSVNHGTQNISFSINEQVIWFGIMFCLIRKKYKQVFVYSTNNIGFNKKKTKYMN